MRTLQQQSQALLHKAGFWLDFRVKDRKMSSYPFCTFYENVDKLPLISPSPQLESRGSKTSYSVGSDPCVKESVRLFLKLVMTHPRSDKLPPVFIDANRKCLGRLGLAKGTW